MVLDGVCREQRSMISQLIGRMREVDLTDDRKIRAPFIVGVG
jgi:hypothetical protein